MELPELDPDPLELPDPDDDELPELPPEGFDGVETVDPEDAPLEPLVPELDVPDEELLFLFDELLDVFLFDAVLFDEVSFFSVSFSSFLDSDSFLLSVFFLLSSVSFVFFFDSDSFWDSSVLSALTTDLDSPPKGPALDPAQTTATKTAAHPTPIKIFW